MVLRDEKTGRILKGSVSPKFKNLKDRRLNHLVVQHREPNDGDGGSRWSCKCDCGRISVIAGDELLFGEQKSCGKCEFTNPLSRKQSATNSLFYSYQKNAAARKVSFLLTREQFDFLIYQPCKYCGAKPRNELFMGKRAGIFLYNGIDRKDNEQNYTVENCVSCCKQCNFAKRSMSYEQFLAWIHTLRLPKISLKAIRSWKQLVPAPPPGVDYSSLSVKVVKE